MMGMPAFFSGIAAIRYLNCTAQEGVLIFIKLENQAGSVSK